MIKTKALQLPRRGKPAKMSMKVYQETLTAMKAKFEQCLLQRLGADG